MPRPRANQRMTGEKFATFLACLSPDSNLAGETYRRLRAGLFNFFAQYGSYFAEELVDKTIDRVTARISDQPIANPVAYCYGVAKNIRRETMRGRQLYLNVDDLVLAVEAPAESSPCRECLETCLAQLSTDMRTLILEYFSEVKFEKIEMHRRTSKRMAMSQTALRMRIARIKQKLRICVSRQMTGEADPEAAKPRECEAQSVPPYLNGTRTSSPKSRRI